MRYHPLHFNYTAAKSAIKWTAHVTVKCIVKSLKNCYTSMKEMPALQTSAWIPYCSPDILSGYEAKTNKCKNKVRDQRITALKQIQKYQRIKSSGVSPPCMH